MPHSTIKRASARVSSRPSVRKAVALSSRTRALRGAHMRTLHDFFASVFEVRGHRKTAAPSPSAHRMRQARFMYRRFYPVHPVLWANTQKAIRSSMFSAEKGLHNVAIASLSDFGVVLAAVKHWDLVTLVRTGHLDTRCTLIRNYLFSWRLQHPTLTPPNLSVICDVFSVCLVSEDDMNQHVASLNERYHTKKVQATTSDHRFTVPKSGYTLLMLEQTFPHTPQGHFRLSNGHIPPGGGTVRDVLAKSLQFHPSFLNMLKGCTYSIYHTLYAFSNTSRPQCSYYFLGPPGSGKSGRIRQMSARGTFDASHIVTTFSTDTFQEHLTQIFHCAKNMSSPFLNFGVLCKEQYVIPEKLACVKEVFGANTNEIKQIVNKQPCQIIDFTSSPIVGLIRCLYRNCSVDSHTSSRFTLDAVICSYITLQQRAHDLWKDVPPLRADDYPRHQKTVRLRGTFVDLLCHSKCVSYTLYGIHPDLMTSLTSPTFRPFERFFGHHELIGEYRKGEFHLQKDKIDWFEAMRQLPSKESLQSIAQGRITTTIVRAVRSPEWRTKMHAFNGMTIAAAYQKALSDEYKSTFRYTNLLLLTTFNANWLRNAHDRDYVRQWCFPREWKDCMVVNTTYIKHEQAPRVTIYTEGGTHATALPLLNVCPHHRGPTLVTFGDHRIALRALITKSAWTHACTRVQQTRSRKWGATRASRSKAPPRSSSRGADVSVTFVLAKRGERASSIWNTHGHIDSSFVSIQYLDDDDKTVDTTDASACVHKHPKSVQFHPTTPSHQGEDGGVHYVESIKDMYKRTYLEWVDGVLTTHDSADDTVIG